MLEDNSFVKFVVKLVLGLASQDLGYTTFSLKNRCFHANACLLIDWA